MAIGYGNSVVNGYDSSAGVDCTFAGTLNAGTDLCLLVTVHTFGITDPTAVTWNGDAMSKLRSQAYGGSGDKVTVWGLLNPDVGSFNLIVTTAFRTKVAGDAYTGVLQSGLPDAVTSGSDATAQTTISTALASVADNCWHFMSFEDDNADTQSSLVNWVARTSNGDNGRVQNGDSNGPKTPAGSLTQGLTFSGSVRRGWVQLTIAPSASSDIKTINGLAYASIKTINGLAIGDVG